MRRQVFVAIMVAAAIALSGCGGTTTEAPTATENGSGILVENAFTFTHVDGRREEQDMTAFVLFEYEQMATVKYQVAYIACTCRGPEVNYWSVAFVEINKSDNSIATISYDDDSSGHYTAGMYGDSVRSWDETPVQELFAGFIQDNIIGATEAEIDAYEAMHGEVDAYTGATVTPNNAMRMLQGLFEYHKANYS